MFCNVRQWTTLYFMLVAYCSCGLNKEKIEHRLALTVFDRNRDIGKCMKFGGFVVVAFRLPVFTAFPSQSVS